LRTEVEGSARFRDSFEDEKIMKGSKVATAVYDEQPRTARPLAAALLGTVIIGSFLGGPVLARPNADAPVTASRRISEASAMNEKKSSPVQRSVQAPSGRISYMEQGTGPVALFVHGVLLNGHLWRHQLEDLSDIRRCIAVDLLAHGDTEIAPDQDVSVTANAKMNKRNAHEAVATATAQTSKSVEQIEEK
jgi:hypothetical protein